jgi:HD superfamily phosphohydrolase YqeK
MSVLEKIIFLADAIEPNRNYPGVEEIRKQADGSIDKACLMSLKGTLDHIKRQDVFIDPDTLEAKDYFEQMEEI